MKFLYCFLISIMFLFIILTLVFSAYFIIPTFEGSILEKINTHPFLFIGLIISITSSIVVVESIMKVENKMLNTN